MTKFIYVEVRIELNDDADASEVVENCDYTFSYEGILSHEIVRVTDERG
jgi:hypothetical protein